MNPEQKKLLFNEYLETEVFTDGATNLIFPGTSASKIDISKY